MQWVQVLKQSHIKIKLNKKHKFHVIDNNRKLMHIVLEYELEKHETLVVTTETAIK